MEGFNSDQLAEIDAIKLLPVAARPEAIATFIHRNQVDKLGEPYINHPRRVAQNVNLYFDLAEDKYTPEDRNIAYQAAWLHDVIEDSVANGFPLLTPETLLDWGTSKEVVEIVDLVTKKAKSTPEPKDDPYYQAIAANELATAVKLCDLTDNSNEERDRELLVKKGETKTPYYKAARWFIAPKGRETQFFNIRTGMPLEITEEEWDSNLKRIKSTTIDLFGDTLEFKYYREVNSGKSREEAANEAIRKNEQGE